MRGASDIEAIEMLLQNNIAVTNHQHLHAKIYLFDCNRAIVTSANLTYKGMNRNYEYGVLIDEKDIISNIVDDCECLIDDELSGEIDIEEINQLKDTIEFLKKTKHKVFVDTDNDEILNVENKLNIPSMSPWQKDVFEIIMNFKNDGFKLNELYFYENELKLKHPDNNNIQAKIRQMLQQLRDKGLIKFVQPGVYKKLIK